MPPMIGLRVGNGKLTRQVLWADDKRVRVRSTWKVKSGDETSHELTLAMSEWAMWVARCSGHPLLVKDN